MNKSNKYSLAMDYHENSKGPIIIQSFDPQTAYKVYPNAKAISLEKNCPKHMLKDKDPFIQTLMSRSSTRAFTTESIDLKTLSQLLTLSCGLRNDTEKPNFRTYASAGARYPVELYVILLKSGELDRGIYHYNILGNTLELLRAGDYCAEISEFYRNQSEGNQSEAVTTDYPCLILFSMILSRTMDKYGERGYRFALLDAGHMSQNLYLVATYLDLGIVELGVGATSDDCLDDLLGISNCEENIFLGFAVGHPVL